MKPEKYLWKFQWWWQQPWLQFSRVWNKVEIAPTNTKRDISSHSTMTQGLPQCNLFLRAHPKQLENDVSVDFTQNEWKHKSFFGQNENLCLTFLCRLENPLVQSLSELTISPYIQTFGTCWPNLTDLMSLCSSWIDQLSTKTISCPFVCLPMMWIWWAKLG